MMRFVSNIKRMKTLGVIVLTAIATLIVTWAADLRFDWPPQQILLALENFRLHERQRSEDRFRIVLCWLEDDKSGDDTRTVEQTFASIKGVEMVRSAKSIAAFGAADEWLPSMRENADELMEDWNADLVIAGRVKKPGEILSLWMVPRLGEGTLDRGDQPYSLEDVTLGEDFRVDLQTQLVAMAMAAVIPLAYNDTRSRVLQEELGDATEKLGRLLNGDTIRKPGHRMTLQRALGDGLHTLGEREIDTKHLEKATAAYRAALKEDGQESMPKARTIVQNNLGNTLLVLGQRKASTNLLKQAVGAYRAALADASREQDMLAWAIAQTNFGVALWALGRQGKDSEILMQAVAAHRAALARISREQHALQWGIIQTNLGTALWALGFQERDSDILMQAVTAHRAALEILTRERAPLKWATAQNDLGIALSDLGKMERNTEPLEAAVAAYRAALEVRTRERTPLDWTITQTNLGKALSTVGYWTEDINILEQAVAAHRAVLEVRDREQAPFDWATTQTDFGNALLALGKRSGGMKYLEQAVAAYRVVLEVRNREQASLGEDWALQTNLGNALWALGLGSKNSDMLKQAVAAYRAALKLRTREQAPLIWASVQTKLGDALKALAKQRTETDTGIKFLYQAVAAYRAALEVRTREREPHDWSTTQNNLGGALLALGQRRGVVKYIEQAVAAYRAALKVRTREQTPFHWKSTRNNLNRALVLLREYGRPDAKSAPPLETRSFSKPY